MGLFSSKKTISVSSTLYNMAGDENDRPDFLKGTLFGSVMSNSQSLADDIQTSYFGGPGMKQRQFFRYCDRVNLSGMPTTTVENNINLDGPTVAGQIPVSPTPPAPAGLTIQVFNAEVTDGDFQPWIERWILQNYPARVIEAWLGEYEPTTNTFSVEFPNNDFFSWTNNVAPIYNPNARYVTAKYIETLASLDSPVEEGTVQTNQPLPTLTGFTKLSDTETSTSVTLQRNRTTIYTFSDGRPAETFEDNVDADVSEVLNTSVEVWQREVVIQQNGIELQGERQIWNLTGTDSVVGGFSSTTVTNTDIGGGVIRTATATTTGEQIAVSYTRRYDTQDIFKGAVYGSEKIFIYQVGTGNAVLDALVTQADASGFQEFFPLMPIRIDNESVAEPAYDSLRADMKKAYRRAYQGKNFDDLIATVDDHPDVNDIDYAYLIFGCSLNVKENACKKYIYKFFEKLIPFQSGGSGNAISGLQSRITQYNSDLNAFRAWENTDHTNWGLVPPRPAIPSVELPELNVIKLKNSELGFDLRISWIHIEIEQFSGRYDTNPSLAGVQQAAVDQVMLTTAPSITWQERENFNTLNQTEQMQTNNVRSMYIYWQVSANSYRRMQIWGLVHENYIYKGKSVKITSKDALEDTEESGFIIPLHYPTMSEMSIVDYTQMSTANAHILFNSYEVVKQRWWQRGIFKILLVILIIVVAVIVFPGAFAGGGGILGGNLALGGALGLTGTAALVAGVVANYIASIIIAEVLKFVGTALFGEKWGALFAAIAGFALSAAMTGMNLFSTDGILKLGNALANGYAGWVQGDIAERMEDLNEDRDAYENRMDEIQKLIDGLGGNDLNFNPLFLTDYGRTGNGRGGSGYMPETSDEYIRRTTMTGSDIVELTHSMVYDFVDVSKTLPRN